MKTAYIIAGVGVVAVVGIVAFMTMDSANQAVTEDGSQTYTDESATLAPVATPETLTGQDTFANLFKLGRTLECSFTFKDQGITSEGTGFFDGKQMRVDSMYMGDGRATYMSSMISDGTIMYLWSKTEAGSFAMKMAVPPEGVTSNTAPVDQSKGGLNPQSKVTYNCKSWKVDGSVFVPPTDIKFMNMDDMMNGMPGAGMPMVPKIN
jgi:hypothetical protein